jgi:tetratricopeptide (TPR) repeat protein
MYAHRPQTRARKFLEKQVTLAREIRDRRGEGRALDNLGRAYYELERPRDALEHHDLALGIARELGDRRSEGSALFNRAQCLIEVGDHRSAIVSARRSLLTWRRIGDTRARRVESWLRDRCFDPDAPTEQTWPRQPL